MECESTHSTQPREAVGPVMNLGSRGNIPKPKRVCRRPVVTVIGNSNVHGLSAELNTMGVETTGFVFSGSPSDIIQNKMND